MVSAEPGTCSRDQQLPWRSRGKRWLVLVGLGLHRLLASGGRHGHAAGSSAADGGNTQCQARHQAAASEGGFGSMGKCLLMKY